MRSTHQHPTFTLESGLPAQMAEPVTPLFNCQDLIALFGHTFSASDNTILVRGEAEPVYLPADQLHAQHRIIFAHGFFASALHEIAHWCLAGQARRLLEDYGYWYCPDGRNAEQQAAFEQAEVKPQAVEWAFSLACGKPFRVSTDNLNGVPVDVAGFTDKVRQQVLHYLASGFPARASLFIHTLQNFYQQPELREQDFYGQ